MDLAIHRLMGVGVSHHDVIDMYHKKQEFCDTNLPNHDIVL